jgi:hypothetical protein
MDGPIATTRSIGRVPNACAMASTAAFGTAEARPRQPACAAATAPVARSAISSGTQSAV